MLRARRSAFVPSRVKSSSFRIWTPKSSTRETGLYMRSSGFLSSMSLAMDRRSPMSCSIFSEIFGRWILSASTVPSRVTARYTWEMEAAAKGFGSMDVKRSRQSGM